MKCLRSVPFVLVLLMILNPQKSESAETYVVAHRGLLRHAPENTLANFSACLELQLGFELDVRKTLDGVLVCVHDETIDRTTNAAGAVTSLTWSELKDLDAGSWFSPRFKGERIPKLEQVFALLKKHAAADVLIAVDLKGVEIESAVVKMAEQYQVLDRLLMIGNAISDRAVRKRLRAASRNTHVACVANNRAELTEAIDDPDSDWVYVRFVPNREDVARIHQRNKQVFIAGPTVAGEQSENWRRAAAVGVAGILTDYPLTLADQLRK